MADIPTPRSYNQILGDMIDAFKAAYPIQNLKVGGPILSILEASAQSDLRNTSDIFKFLASVNLDSTEGTALDNTLRDEGTRRLGATPATGLVTIGDSRYTKLASTVYFGKPAPLIDSDTIYVSNASGWPNSGALYLGRDTANYEGPLNYIAVVNNGSYYTITLHASYKTKKYHNLGESVIVAQGGDRTIAAGTLVRVAQGNAATPNTFSVLYTATLLDGEVSLDGVQVVCTQPGIVGNAPARAINEFDAEPFTGATVSNPLPYTNGFDSESDEQARNRIRALRKARSKGTVPAIEAYLNGITAQDESKRVTSVRVVEREGLPSIAYIDDGTGYEEKSQGVATEILTSSAVGGEEFFQLSLGRPVQKARVETSTVEPWDLTDVSFLAVRVGGIVSQHQFNTSEFRNIANAAAYEVVHSINADPTVAFSASMSDNGRRVAIFAKAETGEDIEVIVPSGVTDANSVLKFPLGLVDTCKLFKNDVLLYKDGRAAVLESNAQSTWQALTSGETLTLGVDGTAAITYTFNDVDFVNAGTAYLSVSANNSLASWAQVFNYKIPGITASVIGNKLQIVSNVGPDARGALNITGGTLVTKTMFADAASVARQRDYTLNRNTGQLKLAVPLVAGDTLTVGTPNTNAFIESGLISTTITIGATDMWFIVDGNSSVIELPIISSTTFTEGTQAIVGAPTQLVLNANQNIFADVQIGDWVVMTDTNFTNKGALRVSHKVSDAILWMSHNNPVAQAVPTALAFGGLAVVRSDIPVQKVSLGAGIYTAEAFATAFAAGLRGARGEVVRTGHFRVTADSRENGEVLYIAGTADAQNIPLTSGIVARNEISQRAFVASSNSDHTAANFNVVTANATLGTNTINGVVSPVANPVTTSDMLVGLRSRVYNGTDDGYSSKLNHFSSIISLVAYTMNTPSTSPWLVKDRAFSARPYAIGPQDDLSVVVDGDVHLKRFEVPMRRTVLTQGNYTNGLNNFLDADNGNLAMASAFGTGFSFRDFAVYMHPRYLTDKGAAAEVLWRWNALGANGDGVAIDYNYPVTSNDTWNWSMSTSITNGAVATPNILSVKMASGAPRGLPNLNQFIRLPRLYQGAQGSISKMYVYTGLKVTAYSTFDNGNGTSTVTLTVAPAVGTMTDHGLVNGNVLWAEFNGGSGLSSGAITLSNTVAGTQIKYLLTPNIPNVSGGPGSYGYVYLESTGGTWDWTSVVADDVIVFGGTWGNASLDNKALYVKEIVVGTDNTALEVWIPEAGIASSTVVAWSNTTNNTVEVFPVGGTTVAMVAAIDDTWPVTAVSNGAGSILKSTWVTNQSMTTHAGAFTDGLNYVIQGEYSGGNYFFGYKNAVSANLTNYIGWADEEVYLVPITAKNVADFLGTTAVSGISQSADITRNSFASSVQITSKTSGRAGSVEVLGGLANSVKADIVGSLSATTEVGAAGSYALVADAEMSGFQSGWWCELANTSLDLKSNNINAPAGTANLTGVAGNVWSFSAAIGSYGGYSNVNFQFERHGRYMAAVWNGIGTDPLIVGYDVGDYIVFRDVGDTISPNNVGVFTIAGLDQTDRVIWFENPNGVEERVTATIVVASRDSVMPGDTINVGTDNWGTENRRIFTVADVNYNNTFTTVETPGATPVMPVLGPQTSVTIKAGSVYKIPKRLTNILPYNSNVGAYSVFVFGGHKQGTNRLSSTYGATITALGKLEFSTSVQEGRDGYAYNTGLIGEANRVVYGLENDRETYPGVVASGASVNVSGPIVRRIQVSLALRIRNGANKTATFDAVRSAVATYINGLGVGVPVAISDIVTVANAVGGVEAVSVASPTYNTSADQIAVQPYEKPLVLQPEQDISLTLVG